MTRTFQPPVELHGAADEDGKPKHFIFNNQKHTVAKHIEGWQIHTDWWESHGAIRNRYFALITDTGMLCVIYCDLNTDKWYMARVYD